MSLVAPRKYRWGCLACAQCEPCTGMPGVSGSLAASSSIVRGAASEPHGPPGHGATRQQQREGSGCRACREDANRSSTFHAENCQAGCRAARQQAAWRMPHPDHSACEAFSRLPEVQGQSAEPALRTDTARGNEARSGSPSAAGRRARAPTIDVADGPDWVLREFFV